VEAVTGMAGEVSVVARAQALTKRYGRTLALDRLDLEIRSGEVLGFLGPNGAGKTTTLRLLMGYLRPTAGSAQVHGLDAWRDRAAVHARTGYLTGRSGSCPRATGKRSGYWPRCWATRTCCCWMSPPAGWTRWSSRSSTTCCGNAPTPVRR